MLLTILPYQSQEFRSSFPCGAFVDARRIPLSVVSFSPFCWSALVLGVLIDLRDKLSKKKRGAGGCPDNCGRAPLGPKTHPRSQLGIRPIAQLSMRPVRQFRWSAFAVVSFCPFRWLALVFGGVYALREFEQKVARAPTPDGATMGWGANRFQTPSMKSANRSVAHPVCQPGTRSSN